MRRARRATMNAKAPSTIEISGAGRFGIIDDSTRPSPSPPASPTTAPSHRQADALLEHQPQHHRLTRAERHAHAELAGALRRRVRHDAEDAERGEHETEPREAAEDVREQSQVRRLPLLGGSRRHQAIHRKVAIERRDDAAQFGRDGIGLSVGAKQDVDDTGSRLRQRLIDLERRCRRSRTRRTTGT